MRKITQKDLDRVLEDHYEYMITIGENGSPANLNSVDLCGADLSKYLLEGVDLTNADLSNSNLNDANLVSAFLTGANLSGANLNCADLNRADLNRANLSKANLTKADLTDANLNYAILNSANLNDTILTDTDLSYADLSGCSIHNSVFRNAIMNRTSFDENSLMGDTIFVNTDLSKVINLEIVLHWGPSSIGIDTIYKSKGKIPKLFLKRAGVPETFIDYMDSLIIKPIDYYSCFISYSRKDEEFVKRLYTDLQANGIRCWLDKEDLKIGDKTRQIIHENIRVHDKLLLILSEESINSSWVEDEVNTAMEKERRNKTISLFPIRIDETVMETNMSWAETIRNDRNIGDYTNWKSHDDYQKAFYRLLRDLKLT